MSRPPRIAVILDEDTSRGGRRYEAAKTYFSAIRDAGGLPFGVPYLPEMAAPVVEEFDGVLSCGGRFAFPPDWYVDGQPAPAPPSERLEVERRIVEGVLARDKPILGICAGMQILACLHGCRMTADVDTQPGAAPHDGAGLLHPVNLAEGSRLRALVGLPSMPVNTFHREAVVVLSSDVTASALAPDGVIEAIELPARRFALGVQWHQEALAADHPGAAVFRGLVEACRG